METLKRAHQAGLALPLICVRCMIRRVASSNGSRRCMVQRLSHSTRSPTRQTCSQVNSGALDESPQLVEQGLGLRQFEPDQIGVAPAAEIEHAASGVGMGADQRMHGARGGPRIVGRGDALAQVAAAVVGAVMLDLQTGDPRFSCGGSAS